MASALVNISKDYFNKGVFVFENGDYIFIEEIQYSHDGQYWEESFIPYEHTDPRDATKTILGHKYRRVRHAGDDEFQLAEYIVAEDGQNPVFRVTSENLLQYKLILETDVEYKTLIDLNTLKGDPGEQGAVGRGWAIDMAGYFYDRPLVMNTVNAWSTTCNTCNPSVNIAIGTSIATYLSIGDGGHIVVANDVSSNYYRSFDGLTWIALTATDIGEVITWMADDNIGTGRVDFRTTDNLGTAGKVYVFYNGIWKLLFNVSVPFYKLAPNATYFSASNNGFYMEDYMSSIAIPTAIEMINPSGGNYKLDVKENGITLYHIDESIFQDGFKIVSEEVKVSSRDFAGYGLTTYASIFDGEENIQIDLRQFIGNGLSFVTVTSTDGESADKLLVNPVDLVDINLSGLTTFVNTDGYTDFKIRTAKGLFINTDGLNVLPDDLSIYTNTSDKVAIKPYDVGVSGSGILSTYLNPTVVNVLKGLLVDNTTGIEIKLSTDHTAIDFDSTGIFITNHGIQGWHLDHNVANAATGAIVMNETTDLLNVVVKAGGGLMIDGANGLAIDTSNLSWINNVVNKIEVGGVDVDGDLVIVGDTSSDNYVKTYVTLLGQTIKVTPETNVANLTGLIRNVIENTEVGSHVHAISGITGLVAALAAKIEDAVVLGSNAKISLADGIQLKSPNGTWYKLIVDDYGQLGT